MTKRSPNASVSALHNKIRQLAAPLLVPRAPKDQQDVVEIFRLALEAGIYKDDLPEITGLSGKMINQFAQAKTSSGRPWMPLRKALRDAGISVPVPLKLSPNVEARVGHLEGHRGRTGAAQPSPVQDVSQPTIAAPVAEVSAAPVAPTAPVMTAAPLIEVRSDGAIVMRPGHPEYADTLRRLIMGQSAQIAA